MTIELDGGRKVKMACVQKQWHANAIMQIARFAGEEIMAINDDAGGFSPKPAVVYVSIVLYQG
ncbi:MAG: hypothetical protein ACTJG9_00335 [Alcaligenes aquatilis]